MAAREVEGSDGAVERDGRGEDAIARDGGELLLLDAMGLAYAARGGRIVVHYPESGSDDSDVRRLNSGFPIGPIPESYWTDPPNIITGQRAELWRNLLDADAARNA